MNSEALNNTQEELDDYSPPMPVHTSEQVKQSRVTDFLDSLGKRKISSSANKRSNTRNYFGEELNSYRSLALKQYNDILVGHKDEDAVSVAPSKCVFYVMYFLFIV